MGSSRGIQNREMADIAIDYASKGFAIDALVASIAEGWRLSQKYGKS